MNPREFVKTELEPIESLDDLRLEWETSSTDIEEVRIFIREKLIAKLAPGATPGWSTVVKKDGPLAKCL